MTNICQKLLFKYAIIYFFLDFTVFPLSLVNAALTTPECYPFVQPSLDMLRGSTKKVFAWYFPPYQLSTSNEADSTNWYERWLSPDGGNGEYRDTGGSLRDRPLAVPQRTESNWKQLNFELEIHQAIAMGLDGFILEMSYKQQHTDDRYNRVYDMLNAAKAVDPGFKIFLAPGFPKESTATPDELAATIKAASTHSSVFRLPDGRLPMATFYPERSATNGGKPISWWKSLFQKLQANGITAAWYPMFLSRSSMQGLPDLEQWYQSIAGYSLWDGRWASQAQSNVDEAMNARSRSLNFMARTSFQESRVRKDTYIELRHWESSNSATLRAFFEKAIEGGANWMTLITWSDYAETQMAPSRDRGYTVADIVAYYTTWFKTGTKPSINRDALYYIHRKQHTSAPYNSALQTAGAYTIPAGPAAENNVELLAFLSAPGDLTIRQGTDVRTITVSTAGLTSFKVPLVAGTTPQFELRRNGILIKSLVSRTPIKSSVDYQDMTYYAGGGIDCVRPLGAPFGRNVTLRAQCNGKLTTSAGGGTNPMWCNRDADYSWEKFLLEDAGTGKVTLKCLGKFCTSEDGTNPMFCNRDAAFSWEKFFWVNNADGTSIALKCSNGKYVSSECGTVAMHCNRDAIGASEKFTIEIV